MNIVKEEQCQTRVMGEGLWGAFHQHQCSKRGTTKRDGKLYCKIHDPEYVEEKARVKSKIWDKQFEVSMIQYHGPRLLKACKDALEASHDPKVEKILMAAIAEVEGGTK